MAFFEKPPISSPTHVFGLPWVASVQCNPFRAAQSHSEFPRSLTGIGTVVAMALPRDWPSSTLSVLRIVIVIIAGFFDLAVFGRISVGVGNTGGTYRSALVQRALRLV